MRGKTRLGLRVDPPPDLAIEFDVTGSSLNRMKIYAALAVPEVWRWAHGVLEFHILRDGTYDAAPVSLSFSSIAAIDLARLLDLRMQLDDTVIISQFRQWVIQQVSD